MRVYVLYMYTVEYETGNSVTQNETQSQHSFDAMHAVNS